MDFGQIIYAIAIIAYFIYQVSKKKNLPDTETDEMNENKESPQKGLTFEELLKEIRNSQNPTAEQPKEVKQEAYRPAPVVAEDTQSKSKPKKQLQPVEDLDDEASFYEGAFGSRSKPNPYQALANKKFEEPQIATFKSYEITSKKTNVYADLLKNPKTLKESVIVSEILRPKYF